MPDWSVQRVEQLAPDAASFKAAQGTAKPAKWKNLGRDERLVWGECQGSGSSPYQVRADLENVTYKCSCPSRKLPCKHTLALLLLFANGGVSEGAAPPFVLEWMENRTKRAEAKQAREAKVVGSTEVDKEAQAKRVEKREVRIAAGLDQLQTWLCDVMAQGLASIRSQPESFWALMAARLIDSQAPGLARRVRELGELAVSSKQWQSDLLAGLARLQLLIDGYRALERLPVELQAEVRTMIGWTQDQNELRQREGVRDGWHVLARRQIEDLNLRSQMTWAYGARSKRFALLLEFAVGAQPLPATYSVGQVLDAELVFFDGAPQLRALEKERHGSSPRSLLLPHPDTVASMLSKFAETLAVNPYTERVPFVLGPVHVHVQAEQVWLVDAAGSTIRLADSCRHGWELLAISADTSLSTFGEWNGQTFDPYCVQRGDALFMLTRVADLPVLSQVA